VGYVEGRLRVMLEACLEINNGEGITANYEHFLGDVHKLDSRSHCKGPCENFSYPKSASYSIITGVIVRPNWA
jgi:hypothetical protein